MAWWLFETETAKHRGKHGQLAAQLLDFVDLLEVAERGRLVGPVTLRLVQQPYDAKDHADRLRALAQELEVETRGVHGHRRPLGDGSATDRAARQLQDYAALLEHAERYGWWDR